MFPLFLFIHSFSRFTQILLLSLDYIHVAATVTRSFWDEVFFKHCQRVRLSCDSSDKKHRLLIGLNPGLPQLHVRVPLSKISNYFTRYWWLVSMTIKTCGFTSWCYKIREWDELTTQQNNNVLMNLSVCRPSLSFLFRGSSFLTFKSPRRPINRNSW